MDSIPDALNQLATRFGGQLLQPLDIGYDEARRVHNGLIDKRPSVIAKFDPANFFHMNQNIRPT
jgi:hypothetical protein